MSSIRISWIFHFFNCLILLTVSGESRPAVRTLLTTRGLNLVRKLVIPVIIKELNNLEIPPISGNVDFFVGGVNYKFKNIKLSDVKIPESHLSMLNSTGLSVTGTRINIELNELWSYEFTSWPFISDKGSATVSAKEISLDVIIGISKSGKEQPSVTANDCRVNIGNLDVEFRGGASFLYNFFMTFIKDQLKSHIEEVMCRNAIKEVNKEINAALSTIPDKITMVNDTVEGNFEPVCPPRFLHNGLELNFKGEFHNVQHPKTPPYTPEELPPISNEHSRMLFMWTTSYTINTMFFAVYQTRSQYYMFTSEDLPDDVPVRLNTNALMLIVPQLFQKYPNKDMAISYNESAPAEITLNPDDGSVTFFGDMTFYVILDDDRLVNCFVLNVTEVADIEDVLIFEKDNYSYIGLKLSSSRTEVTLKETHIGNFDVTLLQFTVEILSEFIMSRSISPRMEEGFRLPLPKWITVFNGDSVVGKDYILIFTDFEISRE